MGFDLQEGFVGNKEKYVAKRYAEENFDEDTNLYVEKRHNGHIRGREFKKIEDLLTDEKYIQEYSNLDDYIYDLVEDGTLYNMIDEDDDLEIEDIDSFIRSLNRVEKINILSKYIDEDLFFLFKNLDKDKKVFITSDSNGEHYSSDNDNTGAILDLIADGQRQNLHNGLNDILEAIERQDITYGDEALICYIYNHMSNKDKNNYLNEYNALQKKDEALPYVEFLEKELQQNLETNKHSKKMINAGNENFDKLNSMYDELNTKYKAILNIKTGLEIYVNSIADDIDNILNDDLSRGDEIELEVLQNVKKALTNILNKNKNDNTALDQIRNEMNSPKEEINQKEIKQSNVRRNR